jgi:hypothetical protein
MKKIIKKSQEVSQLWSDHSGEPFPHNIPPIEINIDFNYGSKFDDESLQLHLNDEEFKPLLRTIKSILGEKSKNEFKKTLELQQKVKGQGIQTPTQPKCLLKELIS